MQGKVSFREWHGLKSGSADRDGTLSRLGEVVL